MVVCAAGSPLGRFGGAARGDTLASPAWTRRLDRWLPPTAGLRFPFISGRGWGSPSDRARLEVSRGLSDTPAAPDWIRAALAG